MGHGLGGPRIGLDVGEVDPEFVGHPTQGRDGVGVDGGGWYGGQHEGVAEGARSERLALGEGVEPHDGRRGDRRHDPEDGRGGEPGAQRTFQNAVLPPELLVRVATAR